MSDQLRKSLARFIKDVDQGGKMEPYVLGEEICVFLYFLGAIEADNLAGLTHFVVEAMKPERVTSRVLADRIVSDFLLGES